MNNNKPIRTQIEWADRHLSYFISEVIILKPKNLPEENETAPVGGFVNHAERKHAGESKEDINNLNGNYETADTKLILYAFEAVDVGVQRIFGMCTDTDVMFLLFNSTAVEAGDFSVLH